MSGAIIPKSRTEAERQSYTLVNDQGQNEVAQRVKVTGLGSLLQGLTYDFIGAAYPSSTQEVYTYKNGGAGGTTVATITVNYTDATKSVLQNVSRT